MTTTQKIELSREIRQWIGIGTPVIIAGLYLLTVKNGKDIDATKMTEMRRTVSDLTSSFNRIGLLDGIFGGRF